MAAGSTYTPIATTTLGSAAASVTFSSLGAYTDIIAVISGTTSNYGNTSLRFNSDSGNNYSVTYLYGDGSAAYSGRTTSTDALRFGSLDTSVIANNIIQIQNYSNSSTYKTALSRGNTTNGSVDARVGLWRNTAAITSITIFVYGGYNFATGSTFTLYGIAAA
jgi:hypothetical protein